MAEDEGFPVAPEAESRSDRSGEGLRCPDCEYVATGDRAAFKLGLHRWRAHGTAGASSKKPKAKKRRGSSEGTPSAPRPTSKAKILRDVQTDLESSLAFLGGLISKPMPLPGGYLLETREEGAAVITKVASRNDRVLGWLTGASVATDYIALGTWAGGFLVAVMVQIGRIDYDHPVAISSGVARLAVEEYGEEALEELKARRHESGAPDEGWGGKPEPDLGNGKTPAQAPVVASPA